MEIPNYTMNSFKLLRSLCEEVEQMIAQFWWGKQKEERGFTRSVEKLCANQKGTVVWASRSSRLSTWLCWTNKASEY